ncbi:uncharacterized protein [Bactrocera oleae]|uniref:uncharacterized protein n=1 Tax=Bactrocera oleae TaxID=104688 RepID=UPI00387E4740
MNHSLSDSIRPNRPRPSHGEQNIAAIAESVHEDCRESIRNRSQHLGLTYGTTWRHHFASWALEKLQEVPAFSSQILFSDEAHFELNGYVNKQNCCIWDEEQFKENQELPVWCGLLADGIIRPYIFKNDVGENVTVNDHRYRVMITDYLMSEIEARDHGCIWFQQGGATFHSSHQLINLLREHFGKQIISRFAPVDWPSRSCDITPLDFFLWGYVKSKVHTDNPASTQTLEQNITRVIRQLPVEILERVIENWTKRMNHLRRSRGQHLKEIIFKK